MTCGSDRIPLLTPFHTPLRKKDDVSPFRLPTAVGRYWDEDEGLAVPSVKAKALGGRTSGRSGSSEVDVFLFGRVILEILVSAGNYWRLSLPQRNYSDSRHGALRLLKRIYWSGPTTTPRFPFVCGSHFTKSSFTVSIQVSRSSE